jgi:hypothetical protein
MFRWQTTGTKESRTNLLEAVEYSGRVRFRFFSQCQEPKAVVVPLKTTRY